MTAISHTVEQIMQDQRPRRHHKISHEQYLQWAAGFVFESLRNQRYGQSFCNYFGITDNILYYAGTVSEADEYIRKNYVE